jgi:predicted O-linked N-acetylglucosamine transferase (SPINDLY family)
MAELDCATPEQYVAKAVELAENPAALTALRERLGTARATHAFFDTRAFARTLEQALRMAWERHEAGLPPADIRVAEAPSR